MRSDLRYRRRSMREPGPMVFLNACGSGQQNATGEPPGFPGRWIDYGALAVIATLCPVPDDFAHAFAVRFYQALFRPGDDAGGRSRCAAEALLETRRHFMEEPYNNPLGLAYVLYARKGLRVRAEGAARRAAP
jgi:hypothetical protein